jgi:hypothetical protein
MPLEGIFMNAGIKQIFVSHAIGNVAMLVVLVVLYCLYQGAQQAIGASYKSQHLS